MNTVSAKSMGGEVTFDPAAATVTVTKGKSRTTVPAATAVVVLNLAGLTVGTLEVLAPGEAAAPVRDLWARSKAVAHSPKVVQWTRPSLNADFAAVADAIAAWQARQRPLAHDGTGVASWDATGTVVRPW